VVSVVQVWCIDMALLRVRTGNHRVWFDLALCDAKFHADQESVRTKHGTATVIGESVSHWQTAFKLNLYASNIVDLDGGEIDMIDWRPGSRHKQSTRHQV
jgi:hypothetical protein